MIKRLNVSHLVAWCRTSERLPVWLFGLFVVWTLALLLCYGFRGYQLLAGAPVSVPVSSAAASMDTMRVLTGWHLFGVYRHADGYLPLTSLRLTLQGTAVDKAHPSRSRAIIAGSNRRSKAYGVGGQLPGGVRLERIDTHGVVLNQGGQLSFLKMPKHVLAGQIG